MKLKTIFTKKAAALGSVGNVLRESRSCTKWLMQDRGDGRRNLNTVAAGLPRAYFRKSFAGAMVASAIFGAVSGAGLSYKMAMKDVRHEKMQAEIAAFENRNKTGIKSAAPPPFFSHMQTEIKEDLTSAWHRARVVPYMARGAMLGLLLSFSIPALRSSYRHYQDATGKPSAP